LLRPKPSPPLRLVHPRISRIHNLECRKGIAGLRSAFLPIDLPFKVAKLR
jgi:hypothetical protein